MARRGAVDRRTRSEIGWPRVAASFDFRNPLHFEDEFEVVVRLAEVGSRSLQSEHTIVRGDVVIGSGRITTVCVQKGPDGAMRATEIPAEILRRLREVLLPSG